MNPDIGILNSESTSQAPPVQSVPEFDLYAEKYFELLNDPSRRRFAKDPRFFLRVKLDALFGLMRMCGMEPEHAHWLDVGCGLGTFLALGKPNVPHAFGCDVSGRMLSAVPKDIDWRIMNEPTRIPYDSGQFDVATCVCVYHHVTPAIRIAHMAEVRRILKPGGFLAIFEHNPRNPVTRAVVRRCPVDEDAILMKRSECLSNLRSAGFTDVSARFTLFLPQSIYQSLGSLAPRIESALGWLPLGGQYVAWGRRPS